MLPAPRVPDGLTITLFFEKRSQTGKARGLLIPDNGIVERFHKTMLNEFYRIAFRRIYATISELLGRYCFGKTSMQTVLDARTIAQEKQIGKQFIAQLEA